MAKDTKTVTLRIPSELSDWINEEGETINSTIVELIETMRYSRAYSTNELKKVFTPNEWKFLADSLNGTMINGFLRCNASALVAHSKDAAQLDNLDNKWGIDITELCDKIQALTGAQTEALYKRVERFWNNPQDIDEWAVF